MRTTSQVPATGGRLSRRALLATGGAALGAVAVATVGPVPTKSGAASSGSSGSAAGGHPTKLSFKSRPDLHPPAISVSGPSGHPGPGYVCVTPGGPMLVDDDGDPVWIGTVPHAATNLRVQRYQGQPVLTWWEGEITHYGVAVDGGEYVIVDTSYREVQRVKAQLGLPAGLHEFFLSADGIAYFTAHRTYTADLRPVGGPKQGKAIDSTIQGVDLATGELVFDWRSTDHIAMTETYQKYSKSSSAPFDPVHVNSIATTQDGKLLVSARNTWTLYKIDPSSGAILWRMAGKKSDFTLGRGVRFAWQHDARSNPDGTISLFDDEGDPPEAKQSRGLFLNVDETAMTVSVNRQYFHPGKRLLAGSQGSVQLLANGDVFVGWGAEPYYTEYRAGGDVVLDAKFATGESYRAFRFPWSGTPSEPPAMALEHRHGQLFAYASWNGSTETAMWQALGGSRPTGLSVVGAASRTGFETTIRIEGSPRYLAAQAVDAQGTALAQSPVVAV